MNLQIDRSHNFFDELTQPLCFIESYEEIEDIEVSREKTDKTDKIEAFLISSIAGF